VVATMKPTAFASLTFMKACVYSGFAWPRLAAMLRIFSLYGRAARMRSCALRIFDAATISMALVIFLVFSTDLILPRISLPTAMTVLLSQECQAGDQAKDFLKAVMAPDSSSSAALSIALSLSSL